MASTQQARRALVLYGSETGSAQDVAEEMGRIAERLRFDTEVAALNAISLKQLLLHDVVLVAISTTGQGELPANSQTLWRALRSARLRPACLQQMKFASFGLGDSSYPKFNWAHRKLYNRLVQLGAQPICDRGESDEQHPEGVDGSFLPWSATLRQRLLDTYPLPEGLGPIPDDVLLDPKWTLVEAHDRAAHDREAHDREAHDRQSAAPTASGDPRDVPPPHLLEIPNGLTATITSNERVTPKTHWQDVRHLKLSLAGTHPYLPGDVLTIYPKNFPSDVTHLLELMDWMPVADTPLHFTPSSPSTPSAATLPVPHLAPTTTTTLRDLLTNHLDILAIPRRSFFAHLAHYTSDAFHRERLLEFTDPQYIDELYDYTTRPRRSILEVLQEFESVKIPWQRVCSVIPALRGRQFSIASAMDMDVDRSLDPLAPDAEAETRGTTNLELLVAIVKYKTVIKRIRQGVATRYISSLTPNQQITVTLSKGGLGVNSKEIDRPVIMVAPGTGVAPMRSLIYQRMQWRRTLAPSKTIDIHPPPPTQDETETQPETQPKDMLFFGCRNRSADYFFQHEWVALAQKAVPLHVFAVFSRDQPHKMYVQDSIRSHAKDVFTSLAKHNAILYICGSSGRMPQAVREALIEAAMQHGEGLGHRQAAEDWLVALERSGRYRQETW